uniref:ADP-ribosylation factor n=1 Tax=Arcella intermedia TaxID=1963864 RepID=A0A6B2LML7_9EUKA
MVGLDGAGKTTALYKPLLREAITTKPTIGFNVENLKHNYINFRIWDIGGLKEIRWMWSQYYANVEGIIFVVDSGDEGRMQEVVPEFKQLMSHKDLNNAALLVLANKKDCPTAMSVDHLTEKLSLHSLQHNWHIQPTCATTGEGLYEGLEWLLNYKPSIHI